MDNKDSAKEEASKKEQSESNPDAPDEEKEHDYKPWELDLRGQPISKRKREITSYEIWMEKKREEEGLEYKCPNCGEENRFLPNVTGQKCKNCGFEITEYKTDTDELDISRGKADTPTTTRLQQSSCDIGRDVGKELAIPEFLQQEPNQPFTLIFKNSSFYIWLFFLLIYIASLIFAIPAIISNSGLFVKWIAFAFFVFAGISIITGLGRTSRITSIRASNEDVIFSGTVGLVQMRYDEIAAISNQRELNNTIRIRGAVESKIPYIIGIYLVIFVLLTYPSLFYSYLSPSAGLLRYLFYVFIILLFFFVHRTFRDTFDSVTADSSSSSFFYNNHISISTKREGVHYSFIGSGNFQFIQALAIVIYMAKKKNAGCRIDRSSIQAAGKGQEHYKAWKRKYDRF